MPLTVCGCKRVELEVVGIRFPGSVVGKIFGRQRKETTDEHMGVDTIQSLHPYDGLD
jgi:hypothetical protein